MTLQEYKDLSENQKVRVKEGSKVIQGVVKYKDSTQVNIKWEDSEDEAEYLTMQEDDYKQLLEVEIYEESPI